MPTHEDRDHHELSFWDTTAATTVIFRKQTVLMVSLWHKVGLKIVLPSVSLSTSPLSSAPSFMSKIQRFICWKVTEEPAWSNEELQMVLLRDWRKSSSQGCCGIGTATGPILPTSLCQTVAGSGALRKFLASQACQLHHHCIFAHLSLWASFSGVGDRLFDF